MPFQPTGVSSSGLTALIQNLGRDCTPSQFLREFTKNAFEAVQRAGGGRVEVDYDPNFHAKRGQFKISFIDNGDGMTPDQMVNLLNNLSATQGSNQHQNYGVGAKISALTRNHAGIQYQSWRGGVGHSMILSYDEVTGAYGIRGVVDDNGVTHYTPRLPAGFTPNIVSEHGTRVTLIGMKPDQDTMLPPEGISGIRESWIVLYLNSRFFRIPDGVELFARIGYYRDAENTRHNYLSQVQGQKAILDEKAEAKGEMQVTGAKVFWWIMPKDIDGHGRERVKGHTALINQDEIFDVSDARSSRIAYFGVIFGRDRVIIYLEPENAVQNTARTGLVRPDGSPLSWDQWQDDFKANMPAVLREFLDKLIDENSKDSHGDSIRERLKNLRELFRLSRYRISQTGTQRANPDSIAPFDTGHEPSTDASVTTTRSSSGATAGDIATTLLTELVASESGVAVTPVSPDPFPQLKWSPETESTRDRAAEYIPPDNMIVANRDFQGLRDLVAYFAKSYQGTPELIQLIEDAVREAFEQALIECVAGALSLKNRPHWNITNFETAVSPEALTTVVMQRYWMVSHIKRNLSKIKAFGDGPANQQTADS